MYEMLESMEKLNGKEEQKIFFQKHKSMGLEEITNLCLHMKIIQENPIKDKFFQAVRSERNCFFHSGKTRTWQTMFTFAKLALLDQLRKEFKPSKDEIQSNKFNFYADILGAHSGRYYSWGNTMTLSLFNSAFTKAEEKIGKHFTAFKRP